MNSSKKNLRKFPTRKSSNISKELKPVSTSSKNVSKAPTRNPIDIEM